jgi:hypothetical protein
MFSRAIVPSFVPQDYSPGNWRQRTQLALAVALSTELQGATFSSSKAGFEPATGRSEVTVAFATGEDRYPFS